MTTLLTMKNARSTSTLSSSLSGAAAPRRVLPFLAAAAMIGSIPGLAASVILLAATLRNGTPLGPDDALALLIETVLLALTAALCWLNMRQAVHKSRRAEAHRRAILDHIGDGVLTLDEGGRFVSANPALLRMIPEEHLRQFDASLEETLRWRQAVFSVATLPVPGVGSVLIFHDETRRHETERAKESLLSTVSHELRTPLSAIINYIELLMTLNQTDRVDTEQFRDYLRRVLHNSRRLDRLVNAILDQAQLEAGVVQLDEKLFNLRGLLENIVVIGQSLARAKHLGVVLILAPKLPTELYGDAGRLEKVLLNLLDNAIKFTPRGVIKINVSLADARTVTIEVIDSGPGIPRAQLPDVFEPFRRASDYAEREHQGAGLGLSIAKQTILRMGGNISVASTPGIGTTFTISLPLKG